MTSREAAAAYLAALQSLLDSAPDGIDIVLLIGNRITDEFSITQSVSDQDTAAMIAVAHHLTGGNAVPDHKPPPEGTIQ